MSLKSIHCWSVSEYMPCDEYKYHKSAEKASQRIWWQWNRFSCKFQQFYIFVNFWYLPENTKTYLLRNIKRLDKFSKQFKFLYIIRLRKRPWIEFGRSSSNFKHSYFHFIKMICHEYSQKWNIDRKSKGSVLKFQSHCKNRNEFSKPNNECIKYAKLFRF